MEKGWKNRNMQKKKPEQQFIKRKSPSGNWRDIFTMEDLSMAGNREQQMYEITKQLEEGVKALFTSERYTEYLKPCQNFIITALIIRF